MKDWRKLLSLLLSVCMCLTLCTAAMASGEADVGETWIEPEHDAETVEPEDAEAPAPAEDGQAFYEEGGEAVQPWARAEESRLETRKGEPVELRIIVDADRTNVSYQWYEKTFFWGDEKSLIEGATEQTYTAVADDWEAAYCCVVTDETSDEEPVTVDFQLYAVSRGSSDQSRFCVYPAGTDPNTYSKTVEVPYGGSAALEMTVVTPDDGRGTLTCRWMLQRRDEPPSDVQVSDSPSLLLGTVTKSAVYMLNASYRAADGESYYWDAAYNVNVANGLTVGLEHNAKVTDYEYMKGNTFYASIWAEPDEPLTLTAIAAADDSENVTYRWIDYSEQSGGPGYGEDKDDAGSIDPTYTKDVPCSTAIDCTVTDKFGNTRYINVIVNVENHLSALFTYPTGAVVTYEYERYGTPMIGLLVQPEAPLEVKAIVSADDADGVTYYWRDSADREHDGPGSEEEDAGGPSYRIESVDENRVIRGQIVDRFNNWVTANFYVTVDNDFSARPEGAEDGRHEVSIAAVKGETYVLKMVTTAKNADGMMYEWGYIDKSDAVHWMGEFKEDNDDGPGYVDGPGYNDFASDSDQLIVTALPATLTYFCEVMDRYGNSGRAYFHLNLNGEMYGTAGSLDLPFDVNEDGAEDAADVVILIQEGEVFKAVRALQQLVR